MTKATRIFTALVLALTLLAGNAAYVMADEHDDDVPMEASLCSDLEELEECGIVEFDALQDEDAETALSPRYFPCCGCGCWDGRCCGGFGCCIAVVWPMPGRQGLGNTNIISPFGWRSSYGRLHEGIDIDAVTNEPVNAIARGFVRDTNNNTSGGGGKSVRIMHPNGFESVYMHLNYYNVNRHDTIHFAGQQVGGAGNTGVETSRPHLHFEIRNTRGIPINPLEIWHRDDSRVGWINPNPFYLLRGGTFMYNPNFNLSVVTRSLDSMQEVFVSDLPYRDVFYEIDSFIIDLVTDDEWEIFWDKVLKSEDAANVMALVQFIQYFNISRETMEDPLRQMNESRELAIAYLIENQSRMGVYDPEVLEALMERIELPNLDIIFTFDNELINEYYRR